MQTSTQPVADFIKEVSEINDLDYGDFMRKANHALLILMDEIYLKGTPKLKELLDQLQDTIQFRPDWDIDSTKKKTSTLLHSIKIELNSENNLH